MRSPLLSLAAALALAYPPASQAQGLAGTVTLRTPITPQGGTAGRPLASRLGDRLSLLDFGAKCDGTSDDSTAIAAAGASGRQVGIPAGLVCYAASLGQAGIAGMFRGPGQIKTSDGSLRGPVVAQVGAPPATLGAGNVVQGFSGDLSHTPSVVEHRVTGSALPLPAAPAAGSGTAYSFTNELAASLLIDYFASGGNVALAGHPNGQRTGYASSIIDLTNAGQGDVAARFASLFVQGPNPGGLPIAGQASFLEGPAGSLLAGSLTAGAPGVYLQGIGDIDLNDAGYDVAAIGQVINLDGTGALGNTWIGIRVQATGPVAADAAFSATGAYKMVLDAVDAGSAGAAVAMAAGQRIYANASQPSSTAFPATVSLGAEWSAYTAGAGWEWTVGGLPALSFGGASGGFSAGAGITNTGAGSTAIGAGHQSSGGAAVLLGAQAADHGNMGADCHASGAIAGGAAGSAQSCEYTLRGVTSSPASTRLTADGNAVAAGGANSVAVAAGSTIAADITVMARDASAAGNWAQWRLTGTLARDAAAASYSGAAPTLSSAGLGSAAALLVGADAGNQALSLAFQAPNSDTRHVVATVRTTEVQ